MIVPSAQLDMICVVVLGNRMRSDYLMNTKLFPDKLGKVGQSGTGRVSHNHSGSQMDDFGPVPDHLSRRTFEVPARAPPAADVPHQLHLAFPLGAECPLTVAERPQAFSHRAGMIAVADDDADLLRFHFDGSPGQALIRWFRRSWRPIGSSGCSTTAPTEQLPVEAGDSRNWP